MAMNYPKTEMVRMYRQMVIGRVYDTMIVNTAQDGEIIGAHHLGRGQEAIGTGIIFSIRDTDWFLPTHRMHSGHLYRCDMKIFAAEQFGKVTGYNKGMACDFHLSEPKLRLMYANGILGQSIPIAVGFAYSLKLDKKDEIVVACEGDGAFTEGINYEALNMAAVYQVPIVMVVEDNGYAISYPSKNNKRNLADRAAAFGISAVTVDGNDVIAVREAVEAAVAKARKNEPCLVECKTLRWDGHHTFDVQSTYRDVSEVEIAKKTNDPITRFEKILFDLKYLTEEEKTTIWKDVKQEVNEAKAFAMAGEYPPAESVLDPNNLYATPWEACI
jgi:acetoin:2,6-dichlorophenolindophenol oxidoreductase subunit alpha